MGARQKLNEAYCAGIAVFSVIAGLVFASIDMALLLGLILLAALVATGSIRFTPEQRSPPHRGRSRRRRN